MIIAEDLAILFLIRAFTEAAMWLVVALLVGIGAVVLWDVLRDVRPAAWACGALLRACLLLYSVGCALRPARSLVARSMCSYWSTGGGSGDDVQPWHLRRDDVQRARWRVEELDHE